MNERIRIGAQLKDYRTQNKLTVRQLADLSSVSYQNITKIENGKYNVSIDILEKLTKALNLTIKLIESD